MQYARFETLIGAVVLAVAAVFLVMLLNTGGHSVRGQGSYTLRAEFRSAAGVGAGSDVRMAGVKIGTVRGLSLNPQSYRAIVAITVNSDLKIPDDSAIAISQQGLLGGSYVEIIPGGSDFFMAHGDTFFDTQGSVSLMSLLLKFIGQQGQNN